MIIITIFVVVIIIDVAYLAVPLGPLEVSVMSYSFFSSCSFSDGLARAKAEPTKSPQVNR